MVVWLIESIVLLLLGLGAVAFTTLLERKVLGLSQNRLGPNKLSYLGVLQPVVDGIKLLFKEQFFINSAQVVLFLMSPTLVLIFFVCMWLLIVPWLVSFFSAKFSSLLFFSLLGLGAYAVILTGLSSISVFSKLGGIRGMLQSLSFEVALILTFMSVLVLLKSLSMEVEEVESSEVLILWGILWMALSLMETNRAPFDLLEGESELISGFNIEMGSLSFVLLFLSEYGMMTVLALVFSSVFQGVIGSSFILFLSLMLFMRSCYPRVRYDSMTTLMWTSVLPFSISLLMISGFLFYSMINQM